MYVPLIWFKRFLWTSSSAALSHWRKLDSVNPRIFCLILTSSFNTEGVVMIFDGFLRCFWGLIAVQFHLRKNNTKIAKPAPFGQNKLNLIHIKTSFWHFEMKCVIGTICTRSAGLRHPSKLSQKPCVFRIPNTCSESLQQLKRIVRLCLLHDDWQGPAGAGFSLG